MGGWRPVLVAFAVLVFGPAGNPSRAAPASACPRVEIAALATATTPSARTAPSPSGPVRLERDDLVSPADIVDAYVNLTEGQPVLNLAFTPEAGRKVRDYTAAHVGGRIAIIVDGRATRVVRILDPIRGDGILIGPVERPAAEALAARLKACAGRRSED